MKTMKTQVLGLSAAALLLAASAAHAAPSETQAYAERAQARAEALLRDAGVDLTGQSVAVRATVRSDGHLSGVYVVDSSGSRDVDHAVETVLRKVVVGDAPLGLIGGAVTIRVGPPPIVRAEGR
jgi:TonB family protein